MIRISKENTAKQERKREEGSKVASVLIITSLFYIVSFLLLLLSICTSPLGCGFVVR